MKLSEQALKDRLRNIAKDKGQTFNQVWKRLVLERFLVHLSSSNVHWHFVFKGGMLLSYYIDIGRETVDIDFLLQRLAADRLEETLNNIISQPSDDGFTFSALRIRPLAQPHMPYPGYRVTMAVTFGRMKDAVQLDIGIGDAVETTAHSLPLTRHRDVPLFEAEISLSVYPPEFIFAEKLEAIVARGATNSRMKDYHDVLLLIRGATLDKNKLQAAVAKTFSFRKTARTLPIHFAPDEVAALQRLWSAHIRGLGAVASKFALKEPIAMVIDEINAYEI